MSEKDYRAPDLALRGPEHVRVYQETDGAEGYEWNGVPTLLLTVTGRRTGAEHTSALIFGRHGDDLLVVASKGGAPRHPLWYVNLQADPRARVQVRDETVVVEARTAGAAEKPELWRIMTDIWPNYDVYQSRTDREIPLVVLSPV
ncbi:nitroreductase family deazaflavin-dependent oxidoreductase [Gordonia sp. CPCC 206044]|uniref:nitroreductase family deazaflavin-dependent oxidoreductase n=1 Tax=Gordonia sp. CPCC 206044 TaxID=3140793 RepID=UPI003AF3D22A